VLWIGYLQWHFRTRGNVKLCRRQVGRYVQSVSPRQGKASRLAPLPQRRCSGNAPRPVALSPQPFSAGVAR
jgi:hypothetical protein